MSEKEWPRCAPGSVLGRWTVLSVEGLVATCRCRCGTERSGVIVWNLRRGISKSCGCLAQERRRAAKTIHGCSRAGGHTKEYRAWQAAKNRCFNPRATGAHLYGGRGIRMCDEWLNDFPAFLAHIGPAPSRGHSVDRIDVNGNYEPGNVRWATRKEQNENTRQVIVVTLADGTGKTLMQLADEHSLPRKLVRWRRYVGWPQDQWFRPIQASRLEQHKRGSRYAGL